MRQHLLAPFFATEVDEFVINCNTQAMESN
jgi:hypothetical protein